MTTKQEIKRLLKERAASIVEERILLETLDNIGDWMGELLGKLTTLPADCSQEKLDEAANMIHEALVAETIRQLQTFPKRKKLSK
jgi:hypothetical protein